MITLTMMSMALLSDMAGATYIFGPIMMGFALPNGPPLGTALVERVELMGTELLMPLYYVTVGRHMDWVAASQQSRLWVSLLLILLVMSLSKLATVVLAAYYCGMPLKSGLILGLIMNFKGTFEVAVFVQMLIDEVTILLFEINNYYNMKIYLVKYHMSLLLNLSITKF
jgi:Kef-type K+ transport system membrane component KefB